MEVYIDGGCRGNPGIGSWAVVIYSANRKSKNITGYELNTTNNRAELQAAISALQEIKGATANIYSDSKYVIDGITKWINKWREQNFKDVKNLDLWQILDKLNGSNITWHWIKGHASNKGNIEADRLCNQTMDDISGITRSFVKYKHTNNILSQIRLNIKRK